MNKKRILIVDDDIHIGNMLEELLRKQEYDVLRAYSGTEAILVLKNSSPDLVLLDLMLPGLNGEDVLPLIKDIPVIVVSAKTGTENKVDLLMQGAADYVTKPFDTQELLARIHVQLRKDTQKTDTLSYGEITLDKLSRSVKANDQPVKLTKTEYAILFTLMHYPKKVFSKDDILLQIADLTLDCDENSLRTHIGNLRNKLRAATGKDYIEAVWGIGYKLAKVE